MPLVFDEIQYAEIGKNIITQGHYSLSGNPSTFTPIMPFLVSLFYLKSFPALGFAMVKLTNLILMLIGLRYCYLFLNKLNLSATVVMSIVLVSAVNNIFVTWSTVIYPESVLFCAFWVFMYHVTDTIKSQRQVITVLLLLMVLILTRYLYAVLVLILCLVLTQYLLQLYHQKKYNRILSTFIIGLVCFLPLLFWFKYVLSVETQIDLNQSYFTRFKNNDIFYNIKAGLGLIKHSEVDKVNGIPAFVSLFVPVTGLRNWIVSIGLILFFTIGYFSKWNSKPYKLLALSIFLVMAGLVFAGTGFSRYWLVLLPGFWLGFYEFSRFLKLKDNYFVIFAVVLSTLYVINEVRLDYIILNRLYQ